MDTTIRQRSMATRSAPVTRTVWWRVVGFGGFVAMLLWASLSKSSPGAFVDGGTFVFTAGGSALLLVGAFGWSGMREAFATLILGPRAGTSQEHGVTFFKAAAVFLLSCGFIATLIGFVVMLQNLSDPSQIGWGMAFALLSELYGAILAVLSFGAAVVIARRQADGRAVGDVAGKAVPVAGAAAAVGAMSCLAAFYTIVVSMLT
jgi:hypothetical protein